MLNAQLGHMKYLSCKRSGSGSGCQRRAALGCCPFHGAVAGLVARLSPCRGQGWGLQPSAPGMQPHPCPTHTCTALTLPPSLTFVEGRGQMWQPYMHKPLWLFLTGIFLPKIPRDWSSASSLVAVPAPHLSGALLSLQVGIEPPRAEQPGARAALWRAPTPHLPQTPAPPCHHVPLEPRLADGEPP